MPKTKRKRVVKVTKDNNFLIFTSLVLLFLLFIALIISPHYKKPQVLPKVKKAAPVYKGRIAIVIDDWGYRLDNLAIVKNIKQPLTCAVLPNLKNSKTVAEDLHSFGLEIILHLPMQPKEKYNLEKNTITLGMNGKKIKEIIDRDLASVIYAKGVSNHMGSAITENRKSSLLVMSEVKKHNLYFLDSYVTVNSVCSGIAKEIKLRLAKRDVFLDNNSDPEYIKGQLIQLRNLSKKYGTAIGIGHDRKSTLTVLKEILPQLESQGYKFVFISEVAR
ncbi:MAG: divergent polysaccharide deacetylase family protein [Candidatus Omnitrophica bacterium]|nr:divergent polysaccharide deacetylase family protein [Candidatus Omnitrophota bacterium]